MNLRRYHLHDPHASPYAATVYAISEQDARNRYRKQWYPHHTRLPDGISVWTP